MNPLSFIRYNHEVVIMLYGPVSKTAYLAEIRLKMFLKILNISNENDYTIKYRNTTNICSVLVFTKCLASGVEMERICEEIEKIVKDENCACSIFIAKKPA